MYDEGVGMVKRDVTFVPGLYKIFDEILVNAADNKQRDASMSMLKVDINPAENYVSVYNNGQGMCHNDTEITRSHARSHAYKTYRRHPGRDPRRGEDLHPRADLWAPVDVVQL